MTTWLAARAAIADIIGDVSITDPISTSIKKVHETQSGKIADWPCVVIMGFSNRTERGPSSLRTKTYGIRLRLLVKDATIAHKQEILEGLSEEIINAFDAHVKLGLADNYHVFEGPNWEEPGPTQLGPSEYYGMDGILMLQMKDAIAFGA